MIGNINSILIVDIQSKLKAMVTQVPQGALNPVPMNMQNQSPKQRSKTQGSKFPVGSSRPKIMKNNFGMLGPQPERSKGWKTLVLDLDETLVHS